MKTIEQSASMAAKPSPYRLLYIVGGIAALTAVLLFRRNLSAELMVSNGFGLFDVPAEAPETAVAWFNLFQESWFVGLALYSFFDVINYLLVGLIFLALFVALKHVHQSGMIIALALTVVGIITFLATNQAFAMFSLSQRYQAATTVEQQNMLLAAGEALIAIDDPSKIFSGFGYFLGLHFILLAGLIISIVMLRSTEFNKATAYAGIIANGLALSMGIVLLLAPAIVWLPPSLSALFRIAWYILIAIQLFRLSRSPKKSQTKSENSTQRPILDKTD